MWGLLGRLYTPYLRQLDARTIRPGRVRRTRGRSAAANRCMRVSPGNAVSACNCWAVHGVPSIAGVLLALLPPQHRGPKLHGVRTAGFERVLSSCDLLGRSIVWSSWIEPAMRHSEIEP